MKTQGSTEKMMGGKKPEPKKAPSTTQRPKEDVKARPTTKPQPKTK